MFKQKNLNLFLLSVPLMNSIARSIYDVAFIWLVLELTNSEKITGLVAMTSYLPAILCGLFIGAIVDLFFKNKNDIVCNDNAGINFVSYSNTIFF